MVLFLACATSDSAPADTVSGSAGPAWYHATVECDGTSAGETLTLTPPRAELPSLIAGAVAWDMDTDGDVDVWEAFGPEIQITAEGAMTLRTCTTEQHAAVSITLGWLE